MAKEKSTKSKNSEKRAAQNRGDSASDFADPVQPSHEKSEQRQDAPKRPPSALSLSVRPDGIAVVTIDSPGESLNTLGENFAADFEALLSDLNQHKNLKGVVLCSGKKNGFIVGADIRVLRKLRNAEDGTRLSKVGQQALNRLADFKLPVVAAIHGPALGGGLEVALACHQRVATDDAKTKLGLPEVQLGLLPGAGGTQRLLNVVEIETALDLLLTGKQLSARSALKAGLVDEVVPEAILLEAACELAKRMGEAGKHARGPSSIKQKALTQTWVGRKILLGQARKALLAKTRGNYPAPSRILDVIAVGLEHGFIAGLEAEAKAFGDLSQTPECAQLINIFFATQELKKENDLAQGALPRQIEKVGVIGAGLMGAGVAYVTSRIAKTPVRLKDKDADGVARGLSHVRSLLTQQVKRKRMTGRELDLQMAQVSAATDFGGFASCDVVIEAVFEDLSLKQQVVRDVALHCKPNVIFATNTSSIPISKIAEASRHPETVIGMHYFSPVDKMPLLEIVVTPKTAPWVIATCVDLGKKQGKTVIVVKDGVGFYTSRILAPFLNEAGHLLSEGVAIEQIDRVMMNAGFPVGPIALIDEVGIDVAAKVGHIVFDAFGERLRAPAGFERLLADGRMGRKNGRGFYRYPAKKGQKEVDRSVYQTLGVTPKNKMPKNRMQDELIKTRCLLAMVNEAALCLEDEVLLRPLDGDIGAIFGLGFPPFLGGPFRYVDAQGAQSIVKQLRELESRVGVRFKPANLLVQMAERAQTFYKS